MILQRVACFSMTRYQQDRGRSSRKRERKKSRTFRIHPKTFISKKIPFRAIISYLSLILSKSKVERGERKYMYTFNFTNELRINFINEPWWTLITIGNCRITLVISRLWCILRVLVSLAPFHDSRREIVRNHLSRSSYVVEKLRESLNLDRLIQKNEIFAIRLRVRYDFQVSSISIEYIYLSLSLLALVQFVMNSDLWEDWISPNIYSRIIYGNGERCRERKIRLFKWNERYRFEGDPISPIESARSICTYAREVGRSIVRVTYAGKLV